MTNNTEACREAFEEWLSEGGKWPSAVERNKEGEYKYAVAMNNWHIWQAAWNTRPASAGEPVAVRYGWDGYGWRHLDNASGSDWLTRHADADPLYTRQPDVSKLVEAVRKTLEDNMHLADGDNCTLYVLREALAEWERCKRICARTFYARKETPMTISDEAVEKVAVAIYREWIDNESTEVGEQEVQWAEYKQSFIESSKAAISAILATGEVVEQKWQPIETLHGCTGHEPILVCDALNHGCPFIAFQMPAKAEWRFYFEGVEFEISDYTHWMPLPKPPQSKEG